MNIPDEAVEAARSIILNVDDGTTLSERDARYVLSEALPYIIEGVAREAERADVGVIMADGGGAVEGSLARHLRSLAPIDAGQP